MRWQKALVLFVAAVVLAACGDNASQSPIPDLEAERAALLERNAAWVQLVAAGGELDEVMSFWAEDAVMIATGEPTVRGRNAIKAHIEPDYNDPNFTVSWKMDETRFSPDGQLAYQLGRTVFTFSDEAGEVQSASGRSFAVWRKDSDGEWRCVVDIWNADPA